MTELPSNLKEDLSRFDQEHVLQFWDELNEQEQQSLISQLSQVDFEELDRLSKQSAEEVDWEQVAQRAAPPTAIRLDGQTDSDESRHARELGEESLRRGEVAVVIVAGGQGTRLGFDQPKGLYPIGPVSDRTLFQVLFDTIRARAARYGTRIPVLLMTSPATHEATQSYLDEHAYLGMSPDDVRLVCQGTMAAVENSTGRLILSDRHQLALSPDGHGGLLSALVRSGNLQRLKSEGFKYLYYCQVDNPLAQIAAPELLGYHRMKQSELTTQVVKKVDALERVGNVVEVDDRLRIIEYSDLPESVAKQTEPSGELRLWAGNIAIHVFNLDFLERVKDDPQALPFHTALKKVPFIDESGELVQPTEINGKKFERFIFDLLPMANNALAVEASKEKAFAPVKNADGAPSDTPEQAKQAISKLAREWLAMTGVEAAAGVKLEINPLYALDADQLKAKISSSTAIESDTYFGEP